MERLRDTENNESVKKVRKHVKQIKGFYLHLFAYCLYTPFTIFINYKTYWDYKWFWFSVIGWGIGLVIHGFVVFVHKGKLGSNWEERKLEELMRKEENKWN